MKMGNQRVASYLEPFGIDFDIRLLDDAPLQCHSEIRAAAGTPESVFRMTPAQLEQITGGIWHDLALG